MNKSAQRTRPLSITTRGGDNGTTGLLYGQRVSKSHPRIEAVGTLDELNVAIGAAKLAARAHAPITSATNADQSANSDAASDDNCPLLETIQQTLVALMGEVACPADAVARYEKSKFEKLTDDALAHLDEKIAALESRGLCVDGWARPGANALALAYDQARVTARRAERRLVALSEKREAKDEPYSSHQEERPLLRPLLLQYLNRLSDLLWLLAREAEGASDSKISSL